MGITHLTVAPATPPPPGDEVGGNEWNDDHVISDPLALGGVNVTGGVTVTDYLSIGATPPATGQIRFSTVTASLASGGDGARMMTVNSPTRGDSDVFFFDETSGHILFGNPNNSDFAPDLIPASTLIFLGRSDHRWGTLYLSTAIDLDNGIVSTLLNNTGFHMAEEGYSLTFNDIRLKLEDFITGGRLEAYGATLQLGNTAIYSEGTLTVDTLFTVGKHIVIGVKTYTIATNGTAAVDGEINRGTTVEEAENNICNAVAGADGINTANADATAFQGEATKVIIQALIAGSAGDTIITTTDSTDGGNGFDAATLGMTLAGQDQHFTYLNGTDRTLYPDVDATGSLGIPGKTWSEIFATLPTSDPNVAGAFYSMDAAGLAAELANGSRYLLVSDGP